MDHDHHGRLEYENTYYTYVHNTQIEIQLDVRIEFTHSKLLSPKSTEMVIVWVQTVPQKESLKETYQLPQLDGMIDVRAHYHLCNLTLLLN